MSCYRVDGLRVAYGYHPHVSASGFCTDTGGRENLGAICRGLLWVNQITKTFWAASVSIRTRLESEMGHFPGVLVKIYLILYRRIT